MESEFRVRPPHADPSSRPLNIPADHAMTDPLHGLTLEAIVTALVDRYGWTELGTRIPIRCFQSDPSIKSSLVFLRRTPWARAKVEALYVAGLREPRP
jgi:uncharacterized protein (DUF2132 family)